MNKINLTEEQKEKVETLASFLTAEQIANYLGFSRATFFNIMQRDEDVLRRYKKGKAECIKDIAGSLISKAKDGDTAAQIFFLKTQAGWKDTSAIEHTSPDGSMTPTAIERVIIDKATDTNA